LKNIYWNALLFALSNLPGNLLSVTLMDRTGRSSLLIGSIMAASMSLFAFAYVAAIESRHDDNANHDNNNNNNDTSASLPRGWIVVAACSFQCFTIAAWNCIDVMTSELFPTKVRSTGMGICAATGRIAAMLAQFINGATVQHPSLLLCIAAVTLAVGGTTPALLPHGADKTGKVMTDNVVVRQEQDAQAEQQPMSTGAVCELGQSTAAPSSRYPYDALRSYERETSIE
jgi:MFS transporter, VNT family, synaptic vesicle glycoprotein 2